jgi:hypothetical protein
MNNNDIPVTKLKRGRKSKKELMASLNINYSNNTDNKNINLNIAEIIQNPNIAEQTEQIEQTEQTGNFKQLKKRGRKPKGGKIIQTINPIPIKVEEKPNVILHLKCSMKDLNSNNNSSNNYVESFNINSKKELSYDVINGIQNINVFNNYSNEITNCSINNDENIDYNSDTENHINELWRKLKQLEHNLHINNVNNKRSACFWDTCNFDNPPIYIPKHYINDSYHVYGCFCSPECAVAYLMNENIDTSTKFERYHLLNHIYSKIYNFKNNIKPAPNPYYMLDKYYGNLTVQEYRSLLRNERLFLIVDKPLTRILPELHEDNEEFILNNKLIPSNNNFQLKTRLSKKKQNKNIILNEKFGVTTNTENIYD